MSAPVGVILAGGLARRMGGGDKGALMLGDRPLLDHVIGRLAPQVSALALNANGDADRFARYDLPVLPDSIDGFVGPLAGVLAGMDWAAAQGADPVISAAADTPFFPRDLVNRLAAKAAGMDYPLVLSATPHPSKGVLRQPTFGLWPVGLRNDLRAALNDGLRKVVQWTDQHNARTALFEVKDYDPFFNVNTPEDLETARHMLENQR